MNVFTVRIVEFKFVPEDNTYSLHYSLEKTKGKLNQLVCADGKISGSEFLKFTVKTKHTTKKGKDEEKMLNMVLMKPGEKRETTFASGFVNLAHYYNAKKDKQFVVSMKTKAKQSFDLVIAIKCQDEESFEKEKYEIKTPPPEMATSGKLSYVDGEEPEEEKVDDNDNVPVKDVIFFFKEKATNPKEILSFAQYLLEVWADGKRHVHLDCIPYLYMNEDEGIWLLTVLKKMLSNIPSDEDTNQSRMKYLRKKGKPSEEQLQDVYTKVAIDLIKTYCSKFESLLDGLINVDFFSSTKTSYEESCAYAILHQMLGAYNKCKKYDNKVGVMMLKQIINFVNYYCIEEVAKRNMVMGFKGFQFNFFVCFIQNLMKSEVIFKDLKKYADDFEPLVECARLISLQMTIEMVADKENLFPELSYKAMYEVLSKYRLDKFVYYHLLIPTNLMQ